MDTRELPLPVTQDTQLLTSVLSRIPHLCGRGLRQSQGIRESKASPAGKLTQKVLLTRGEGHKQAEGGGDGD